MPPKVICTNEKNISMTLTWNDFAPFHLLDLEGVYGIEGNVVTSDNTAIDGSTFQGATARQRNIILTFEMDESHKENRERLYRCFAVTRPGVLEYVENGDSRSIEYIVEAIMPGMTRGRVRNYAVSLICPSPYFTDLADIEVMMASWVPNVFFPHCFVAGGAEFGYRHAELVKVIENESGAENIGITTVFHADGDVMNPAIHHMEAGKFTRIGSAENPFTLRPGQYAVINTRIGNKNVFLLDGITAADIEGCKDRLGVIDWNRAVTRHGQSINRYLDEDADFIQLQDGINTIAYTADEGIGHLSVSVYYRISYLGV